MAGRRVVSKCGIVVAVVFLCGCTTPTSSGSAPSATTSATPLGAGQAASPATSEDQSTPHHRGAVTVADLRGRLLALAAGDGSIFGLEGASRRGVRPIRMQPDGDLSRGPPLTGTGRPDAIAYVAGALWVADNAGELWRLDPTTLTVQAKASTGMPIHQLLVRGDRIWLVGGDVVRRIDPVTGEEEARFTEPARILTAAVSLDGERLYVALAGPIREDHVPLVERSTASGALLASAWDGYAELAGISVLTPITGGLWVGYPTGNMGGAWRYDLALHRRLVGPEPGGIVGTNGIRLWRARGYLWEFSPDGSVSCLEPATGTNLGYVSAPQQNFLAYRGVVEAGGSVFAAGLNKIYRLNVRLACTRSS
jgi:hypothetical protein